MPLRHIFRFSPDADFFFAYAAFHIIFSPLFFF